MTDSKLRYGDDVGNLPNLNALVAFSALTLLVRQQEGHLACKKWGMVVLGGGGHWLVQTEWHPARCSVCLPLLIFPCTMKSRSSLLALAHLSGPGKRAAKWLWCGVVDRLQTCVLILAHYVKT